MTDVAKREYLDREALDALVALCDREARLFSERNGIADRKDKSCPYAILNELTGDLYLRLLEIARCQGTAGNAQPPYVVTMRHVTALLAQYGVTQDRFLVEE